MLTLWAQWRVRTSVLGVLYIALYLGGIFVFHITTPSLFNVEPYNVTSSVNRTTQLGRSMPILSNYDLNDRAQ